MNDLQENAKRVLANSDETAIFADLNRLPAEAAKNLLEKLVKEPEISKEAIECVSSLKTPEEFKAYNAGEEKGRKSGHNEGLGKGMALGVIGTAGLLTLAGLAYLQIKKDN